MLTFLADVGAKRGYSHSNPGPSENELKQAVTNAKKVRPEQVKYIEVIVTQESHLHRRPDCPAPAPIS